MITGKLAESELMRVVLHFFEAELASDRFKVSVVGVRQRLGKIHAAAAAERNLSSLVDHTLAQRRQSDRKFDGGAWLRAARKREPLVHHGEDASAGRLNCYHCAIHVAQRIDCRLTDYRIFAGRYVTFSDIGRERTGVKSLVITMAANTADRTSADSRTAGRTCGGRARA